MAPGDSWRSVTWIPTGRTRSGLHRLRLGGERRRPRGDQFIEAQFGAGGDPGAALVRGGPGPGTGGGPTRADGPSVRRQERFRRRNAVRVRVGLHLLGRVRVGGHRRHRAIVRIGRPWKMSLAISG